MAAELIATFAEVYTYFRGVYKTSHQYQNAAPGKRIQHGRYAYDFLPFIYSGATVTRTGDNVEAQLTMSTNVIAVNVAGGLIASPEAWVNRGYRIKVEVVRMNSAFDQVDSVLSTENWLISSMAYDSSQCDLVLSSGLDAVGSTIPHRILITGDVGPLPTTGQVSL